jgi:hypothetical protein
MRLHEARTRLIGAGVACGLAGLALGVVYIDKTMDGGHHQTAISCESQAPDSGVLESQSSNQLIVVDDPSEIPTRPGAKVTNPSIVIANTSEQAVTITSVKPVTCGDSSAFHTLGAMMAGPKRETGAIVNDIVQNFPPDKDPSMGDFGPLVAAEGYVLAPKSEFGANELFSAELMIGLERSQLRDAASAILYLSSGANVGYVTQDGEHHEEFVPGALSICNQDSIADCTKETLAWFRAQ